MNEPRVVVALSAFLFIAAPAAGGAADLETLVIGTASGEKTFHVEVADEPQERSRGLMFRRSMADDHGMLFDFEEEEPASFWMRNTYIPLDMIFIEADGTIESIAERTTPLSEKSVRSRGPVRYVLEINGGLSETLGIEPGDTVTGPAMQASE
jgi:uncharacterized membrane protein (UPF0127 family)